MEQHSTGPVLVTGGCGFIGSHVVDALVAQGTPLVVLDAMTWAAHVNARRVRDALGHRLVLGDVRDAAALDRAVACLGEQPSVVLHLAAESHVDRSLLQPAEAFSVNAVGTMVVARWCADRRYPLVYCSTDEVYGDLAGGPWEDTGADECTTPLRPSSPYSAGKAAGEQAVAAACRSYGLRAVVTRGCNAWGERQVPEKVVPLACRLLSSGQSVPLHGGGQQVRQWIHVGEFVQGLLHAADDVLGTTPGAHRVFNLAGPERMTVRELVYLLAAQAGVAPHAAGVLVADRPGQDRAYNVNGARARAAWGYNPARRLGDPAALRALLEHYGTGRVELAPWCREATP